VLFLVVPSALSSFSHGVNKGSDPKVSDLWVDYDYNYGSFYCEVRILRFIFLV
jgi:hypothetical protein